VQWIFTFFNKDAVDQTLEGPTVAQKKAFDAWLEKRANKFVYQLERGKESKKLHWQGVLALHKKMRWQQIMNELKKIGIEGIWLMPLDTKIKQSWLKMVRYCSKGADKGRVEGPYIKGVVFSNNQGVPKLKELHTDIKGGMAFTGICDKHFEVMVRSHGNVKKLYEVLAPKPAKVVRRVYFHFGGSGSGKTTTIERMYPGDQVYYVSRPNSTHGAIWWDGYDPAKHRVVVFDEFYGWIKCDDFLRWTDQGNPIIQVKGGSEKLCAEVVIFTSNTPWRKWYAKHLESKPQHYMAIHRRTENGEIRQFKRTKLRDGETWETIAFDRIYKVVDKFDDDLYDEVGLPKQQEEEAQEALVPYRPGFVRDI